MNEQFIVLLEWFRANGITEFFNNNSVAFINDEQNKKNTSIINPVKNKGLEFVIDNLAEKQNNIKKSFFLNDFILEAKNICDCINNINDLKNCIHNFEGYNNIKKLSQNTVFCEGSLNSKILIINDFPNDEDDVNGTVFSGESQLLMSKMLNAINIEYNNCCFINSFFWRLAGNRIPIKEEFEMCKPFVEKFISILKPNIIIFTGNYGIGALTDINSSILKIHGNFFDYNNMYLLEKIKSTAIFSPNFLLKNIAKKRETWQDLLNIKEFLEKNNV